MAPAAAFVWLVAAAPSGPGVREAFLVAIASVVVVAAAARSEGLHEDQSVVQLAARRAMSQSLNVLLLLLFLALAAGVGGTLGGMAADAAGWSVDTVGTVAAMVAAFPVLAWYWPLSALAVVVPEAAGFRPGGSRWLWQGPGYTSARRLVRDFGTMTGTGAIAGVAYLWLALLLAADAYAGEGSFPALIEASSYALFLPLLAWMAVVETRRIVDAALGGS
jgi:hypothetical protein